MPADVDTSCFSDSEILSKARKFISENLDRSLIDELENKYYFPRYPDDGWTLFPDRQEIDCLYSHVFYKIDGTGPRNEPISLDGTDTLSLFDAAILIGDRILGRPAALLSGLSNMYTEAILTGELVPRHPRTLIKHGDPKGVGLPDLTWQLFPEELEAFSLRTWGRTVYTEAEVPSKIDLDEAPGPISKKTYLRIIKALTRALADSHPNAMKKADGNILVGTVRDTGDSGVVGHLVKHEYAIEVKRATLETYIGTALKAE